MSYKPFPKPFAAEAKKDWGAAPNPVAQIDPASGVVNDIAAISEVRRAVGHEALLMVDTVASLGCMKFEMDKWSVDVAVAGSQQGLMMAPGLGFVANDRARGAQEGGPAHAVLGLDRS